MSKTVKGFGIVSPQGDLWPWVSGFAKAVAQEEYAQMAGQSWALLHKLGYRCVRVEVKAL